jgi:Protein of unknown function (DUF2628)
MASWVVLEAPPGAAVPEGEELVFLRDGFSFLAFLFPPLWLLWHKLWVEAAVTFAVLLGAAAAEQIAGLSVSAPLQLLVSIFVGLEGNSFRIARRRRRGWEEIAVVDARNADDAETRYLEGEGRDDDERPADRQPIVPAATAAARPSVGLLLNPGR